MVGLASHQNEVLQVLNSSKVTAAYNASGLQFTAYIAPDERSSKQSYRLFVRLASTIHMHVVDAKLSLRGAF